jgi:hypothetical protein
VAELFEYLHRVLLDRPDGIKKNASAETGNDIWLATIEGNEVPSHL